MSQYDDNDQDQGPDITALREAAKRGESASKRADDAERRIALLEAGVDTKSPVGKLFTEAYKGALDEESIKAAWSELAPVSGGNTPPVEPEPPTSTTDQLDETEQRRLLTSGGASSTPVEAPPVDPVVAGYEEMHTRMKAGEGRDKAAGSVFAHLIEAANAGDERAIWTGWTKEDLGH